jgi:DNA-binding NarL/FixJ family response regulator
MSDPIWVIDSRVVATAVAGLLTESLAQPVRPVFPPDLPAEPDYRLALIEIFLPGGCGITTAAHLRRLHRGSIALWSSRPAPLYSWVSWRLGLSGCLDKDESPAETSRTVHRLLAGAAVTRIALRRV